MQWDHQHCLLFREMDTNRGCLSFFLGGKAPSDTEKWTPNISTVRATVKYALATGRLKGDPTWVPEAVQGLHRLE